MLQVVPLLDPDSITLPLVSRMIAITWFGSVTFLKCHKVYIICFLKKMNWKIRRGIYQFKVKDAMKDSGSLWSKFVLEGQSYEETASMVEDILHVSGNSYTTFCTETHCIPGHRYDQLSNHQRTY